MAKGQFWDDTFERVLELGQSTAKASAKAIGSTFSPLKILESATGIKTTEDSGAEKMKTEAQKKKNSTTLDLDKLQKKYQDQDKMKTEALRMRLFQLVKRGDEESVIRMRQEEEEKKRKELYEEEEKKKKKNEQKRMQEQSSNPKGKTKKSIFSPKKAAQREQVEVKANSGKQ